jgi:hypothetical protein
LEHKSTLLQSQRSGKGTGAGAEREDTDALATMIAAEVVREDTRDDHVQEMTTRIDDTDTDEMTATMIAETALQRTKQSAGNITAAASAQGRDLGSAEDTGVARRETGEKEKETAIDTDVMIERQNLHSDITKE